jgi:hypothetical protein
VLIEAINNPELNAGLMTIPCMVFYVMQLFIDSFIANTWSGKLTIVQGSRIGICRGKQHTKRCWQQHGCSAGAQQS